MVDLVTARRRNGIKLFLVFSARCRSRSHVVRVRFRDGRGHLQMMALCALVVPTRQQHGQTTDITGWNVELRHQRVRDGAYLGSIWACAFQSLLESDIYAFKAI